MSSNTSGGYHRPPFLFERTFCDLTLHSQVTLWIESRRHARGCTFSPDVQS